MNSKLREYIDKSGLTFEQFAGKCNITRQTLYNVMNRRLDSYRTITLTNIVKQTGGEITLEDLVANGK